MVVSLFPPRRAHDGDDLGYFRARLSGLGVKSNMIRHRPGVEQHTADWLSRVKENIRSPRQRRAAATVGTFLPVCIEEEAEGETGRVDCQDYDSNDNDDSENELAAPEDVAANLGRYVTAALQDLPSVHSYTDCQQQDSQLQRWKKMCEGREREIEENSKGEKPEHNEVGRMRVRGGELQYFTGGGENGALGVWVPVLTRGAARKLCKATHSALTHAGWNRLYT